MVLFGKRKSELWHLQIDLAAGNEHPTDEKFPWALLRLHTDQYLKKKGKLSQAERDLRLGALIHEHDSNSKDIAMAACAYAMSPQAVRAALNVELNVSPVTYIGLYSYLQAFVAANHCNKDAVSDLEAQWARDLIPYATPGAAAPGRYLQGVTALLGNGNLPSLNLLPEFAVLARRAFVDFSSHLEGLKLKCEWSAAHASVSWLSALLDRPSATSSSRLGPEQLLDIQFPNWRIWAAWRPNTGRLRLLESLPSHRRAVLPALIALEGPDFLTGRQPTLRDGIYAYNFRKAQLNVRYGTLSIELNMGTASELRNMLDRLSSTLESACRAGNEAMSLFVQLCAGKPINQEKLQILVGVSHIPDRTISASVLEIYSQRDVLGSKEARAMMRLLPALEDDNGKLLQGVLCPYLINGVQNCVQEMQDDLHKQLASSAPWNGAVVLQEFGQVLKEATCMHPLLDAPLRALLYSWPSLEVLNTLVAIRVAAENTAIRTPVPNSLTSLLDLYCMDRLIKRDSINAPCARLINGLVQLWQQAPDSDRRSLALVVARNSEMESDLRCRCLNQLPSLPDDFVGSFKKIMDKYSKDGDLSCIELAHLLATTHLMEAVDCWRPILYRMIEQRDDTLMHYSLANLKSQEWLGLLWNLSTIFGDLIGTSSLSSAPAVLQQQLQHWSQQLSQYVPTIERLETAIGAGPALHCLLLGTEGPGVENLIGILDYLQRNHNSPAEPMMQLITRFLVLDETQTTQHQAHSGEPRRCESPPRQSQLPQDPATELSPFKQHLSPSTEKVAQFNKVFEALELLSKTSPEGREVIQRLLDHYKKTSKIVVEALVACWSQAEGATVHDNDCRALRVIAELLGFDVKGELTDDKIEAATKYVKEQAAEVLEEARRLESMRVVLKAKDPHGTTALLASLGLEDSSPLDDELETLPAGLLDLIEKCGEQEVEMNFPLNEFTDFQLDGFGATGAQSVLMRLIVDISDLEGLPPAFCIHLDNEPKSPDNEHFHWVAFKDAGDPEQSQCSGRHSRITLHLSRIVSRHLKSKGFSSLEKIHTFITAQIKQLASNCVVCGNPHGDKQVRLRRPTPCQTPVCSKIWNRISIDVRLTEIRSDPTVVDLLLTGIFAAAHTRQPELLPGCPIKSPDTILGILNALPSMSVLQKVENLSARLKLAHAQAEQFLTWACSFYRGFLASASGIVRIPNLTGSQQFILASAAPDMESTFAAKVGRGATKVLFHGTSMDRLPSILAQGLRVCSKTPLQRNGTAHGVGIYLGEDPHISWSYSTPAALSWRSSQFHNMKLLLGCEAVGNGNPVSGSIHVIKDPATVMVRYVMLFPSAAVSAPLVQNVSPAMAITFAALKSGSL